tara:strand:- start:8698 stop:8802 length:105 start_codon:yes stop_codon:yes gene_type:complete
MEYCAANGFGGMNIASARTIIKNSDFSATIKSIQ